MTCWGLTLKQTSDHTGGIETINARRPLPMERGPKIFGGESSGVENRAWVFGIGNGGRGDGLAESSHVEYGGVDSINLPQSIIGGAAAPSLC